VLEEAKRVKKTWMEIKTDAKNRVRWRILVEALCSAAELRNFIYTRTDGIFYIITSGYMFRIYLFQPSSG